MSFTPPPLPFTWRRMIARTLFVFIGLFFGMTSIGILLVLKLNLPTPTAVIGQAVVVLGACGTFLIWAFGPISNLISHKRKRFVLLSYGWVLVRDGVDWRFHQTISQVLLNAGTADLDPILALGRIPKVISRGYLGDFRQIIIPAGFIRKENLSKLTGQVQRAGKTAFLERLGRLILWPELALRRKIAHRILGREVKPARFTEPYKWEGCLTKERALSDEFRHKLAQLRPKKNKPVEEL